MIGLVCGLLISMWIAFGKPKPPPDFKPVSIEGCPISSNSSTLEDSGLLPSPSVSAAADFWNSENVTQDGSDYDISVVSLSSVFNSTRNFNSTIGFNETNPVTVDKR